MNDRSIDARTIRRVGKLRNVYNRIAAFNDWYKLTFPFNRLFNGPMTLHMRNGNIPVYVRDRFSTDYLVAMDIFWENQYHLDQISLPARPTVVDLGANIGMFSLAVKRLYPGARIIAYEPHPDTFQILSKNAPFAKLHQEAASGRHGVAHFQADGGATGLHLIDSGGIEVQSRTLDQILAHVPEVDLLKIDIEGAEKELMEGASATTLQKVDRIFMEVHTTVADRFHWAERILHRAGFSTRWEDPLGVIYGERVSQNLREQSRRSANRLRRH